MRSRWWFGNDELLYDLVWAYNTTRPTATIKLDLTEWDILYTEVQMFYIWSSPIFDAHPWVTMIISKL